MDGTRITLESRLERYLEVERLLKMFFSSFDYCLSKCIKPELRKNGDRPVAACCTKPYYSLMDLEHPAFERLKQERETLFGRPEDYSWENAVSPCEYHNPAKGCLLETHKSPVCIAFLCPDGIDLLRNRYGVYGYDFSGIYYALEWILTGDFSDQQYCEFKDGIKAMTVKIISSGGASTL